PLRPFAMLAAVAMLALIMTGAALTSSTDPERRASLLAAHSSIAVAARLLTIGLMISFWRFSRGNFARLSLVILPVMLREFWLGFPLKTSAGPLNGTLHAALAAFLFAALAATLRSTSASWQNDPIPVQDSGRPSLRLL